tara:strand:- start:1352 stop:2113 length:762 start_codon:yes stop_codon:yes gene_type:complete
MKITRKRLVKIIKEELSPLREQHGATLQPAHGIRGKVEQYMNGNAPGCEPFEDPLNASGWGNAPDCPNWSHTDINFVKNQWQNMLNQLKRIPSVPADDVVEASVVAASESWQLRDKERVKEEVITYARELTLRRRYAKLYNCVHTIIGNKAHKFSLLQPGLTSCGRDRLKQEAPDSFHFFRGLEDRSIDFLEAERNILNSLARWVTCSLLMKDLTGALINRNEEYYEVMKTLDSSQDTGSGVSWGEFPFDSLA